MLKYEWRPGVTIENEDTAIEAQDIANNETTLIDPPPIAQELPEAGPNPLAITLSPLPPEAQGADNTQPVGQVQNDPAVVENKQGDDQGACVIGENEGAQQINTEKRNIKE